MPRFRDLHATTEQTSIVLQFHVDTAGILAWQLTDPHTGAHLHEGNWSETPAGLVSLRVPLPSEEGAYRVKVAPVDARSQYIAIEAHVSAGSVEIGPPRIATVTRDTLRRSLRTIPRVLTLPLRAVLQNHRLIRSMVRRDILARYRGSVAGALWTLLNPLLLMATYAFVFGFVLQSRFAGDPTRTGYVLYFLAGMLPWLAISEALGRAPSVVVEHRTFVKKLRFPIEILPVNLAAAGLVTQAIATAMLLVFTFRWEALWLPVLLIPQLLLTSGLAWALAATGVFLRDLGHGIGFALTLWFFLTPICYPEDLLPPAAASVLAWNPLAVLVRGYRAILLEGRPPESDQMLYLWLGSALVAVLGAAWFHRLRRSFADVL